MDSGTKQRSWTPQRPLDLCAVLAPLRRGRGDPTMRVDDEGIGTVHATVSYHPLIAQARRRMPGLRLGATRRVWDVLVPAVLAQKVTGVEAARRSWRELCWRFGARAPGTAGGGRGGAPGRA